MAPPKCLENIVTLCFEKRFSKQNSVIRLKSYTLTPPKFFGHPKFLGWLRHWYISVTSFCLFCIAEHHFLKMTFHQNVKKNLFHILTNIPAFSGLLAGQRAQRRISLPPGIASAISSIVFFDDDTSGRSSATAPLVKLDLFSSLRRSKTVATCSSIFSHFTGSAEMSPLEFTATVKYSLECFLTWLQLIPLSFLPLAFLHLENHLGELYTC